MIMNTPIRTHASHDYSTFAFQKPHYPTPTVLNDFRKRENLVAKFSKEKKLEVEDDLAEYSA